MIGIINRTGKKTGWNTYELRINFDVIGRFTHRREDGLAECLRKAAECAEKVREEEI